MLVSAINFLLRDNIFGSLPEICEFYHLDQKDLEQKLKSAGFEYSESLHKVW